MNTDTPKTDVWEAYCDECYYHMWRLRRKTERGWYDGFHIHTGEEAKGLCETLNKLERERDEARAEMIRWQCIAEGRGRTDDDEQLAAVTEQRNEAREALRTGGMLNIIDRAAHERAAAIRERDEARDEMIRWQSIAEGRGRTDDDDTGKAMSNLIRQRDEAREQLAAARAEIDEIHATGGCSYIELHKVTEQRDEYKMALHSAENHNHAMATRLEIVTDQRDNLAEALRKVCRSRP